MKCTWHQQNPGVKPPEGLDEIVALCQDCQEFVVVEFRQTLSKIDNPPEIFEDVLNMTESLIRFSARTTERLERALEMNLQVEDYTLP